MLRTILCAFGIALTAAVPLCAQDLSPKAKAALDARNAGQPTQAQNWMISAANPLAVQAGADVLKAGGTAADAMVAVQAVLGLVAVSYTHLTLPTKA